MGNCAPMPIGNRPNPGHYIKPKEPPSCMGTHENKQPTPVEFKIHIAIDFGTDGCALAFAYEGNITVYNKWMTKRRKRATKAKTQLLLNEKNEVVAFGDNAKIIYSSLTGSEKTKWRFFERFKMSLYEENTQEPTTHDHVHDEVFVHVLKYLQTIAKKHMAKITQNAPIKDNEIQWIVTVPAIWSEKAKKRMKHFIIKAGLVSEYVKDQCLIVYEPDCAALCIFEEQKNKPLKKARILYLIQHEWKIILDDAEHRRLKPICTTISKFIGPAHLTSRTGSQYMLIDAGGGTVDIACHKIVDDGLEEVHYPTGKDWGGGCVDDLFIEWLEEMFGTPFMNDFKLSSPNHYLQILDYFQIAKASFFKKKTQSNETHSVELPSEFIDLLYTSFELDRMLQDYSRSHHVVQLIEDSQTLLIDVELWKKWFDEVINKIIRYIEIEDKELYKLLTSDDCKYLYLVGGFSQSKYFQHRMKLNSSVIPYNLKVIVPAQPVLCVVKGAAYFGMKKVMMKARIMPCTYGVARRTTQEHAIKLGLSEQFIETHRRRDVWVVGIFDILTKKGDRVERNQPVISN
eukprot:516383_1